MTTEPERQRADAVAELLPLAARRRKLDAELKALDAELRPTVRKAVAVGVQQKRVAEIFGVTRNTVARWSTESDGKP